MTAIERFLGWLRRASGIGETADIGRIINQTQRFNLTLFTVALVAISAILIAGTVTQGAIQQIVWGLIGAFASAVVGAALGVLFGLPTVESKRAALIAAQ